MAVRFPISIRKVQERPKRFSKHVLYRGSTDVETQEVASAFRAMPASRTERNVNFVD